ncbi:MAG: glucose-6-phosphate dehydrogenase, partial [Planctomycetes bacterium]|nr:glucose-6-phosphate dehydrogenase [Planctomycetota bacterium]
TFGRKKAVDPRLWEPFARCLFYHAGDLRDPEAYRRLRDRLEAIGRERGGLARWVYYLATPPSAYGEIAGQLAGAGIAGRDEPRARIVIEKPFGRDLGSAKALNRELERGFREDQIFRIDHYLGKETVQNILVLRFANAVFEPLWNYRHVDHVQIVAGEDLGMEGRGASYQEVGALRDMVQNHLLQLLALTAMEPPIRLDGDAIRDEKVKVLRSVRRIAPAEVPAGTVRGQYGRSAVRGSPVPAFREEDRVAPDSRTETYAAVRLRIDNWRWAGVPFYLRAGKRLARRGSQISIHFHEVPRILYNDPGVARVDPDVLVLRIQPDEGLALRIASKVPGTARTVQPVRMEFRLGAAFSSEPPDAYERLLEDALAGDPTLFTRRDEVEEAWAIVTPILDAWDAMPPPAFPNYAPGSWGPKDADAWIASDGRAWRRI